MAIRSHRSQGSKNRRCRDFPNGRSLKAKSPALPFQLTSANGKFGRSFFNSLTYFPDSSRRRNNIPRRHGTFLPKREGRKFFRMAPLKWIFHQSKTFGDCRSYRESGQRGGVKGNGRTNTTTLAKMKWTFHNILIMAIPCRQFSKTAGCRNDA